MRLDPPVVWQFIADRLRALDPPAGIVQRVTALANSQCPDPAWQKMAIGVATAEESQLGPWFTNTLIQNPPAEPLTGLWFGLKTPVDDIGAPYHALYVAGVSGQAAATLDGELVFDLNWFPEGPDAPLETLRQFPTGFEEPPGPVDLEAAWALPIAFAASAVCHLARDLSRGTWAAPTTAVAVGYDSGDLLVLGTLGPGGFTFADNLGAT